MAPSGNRKGSTSHLVTTKGDVFTDFFRKKSQSMLLQDCGKVLSHLSPVSLSAASCTVARQAPLSLGFLRQELWSGLHFLFRGSFRPRDQTRVSCMSFLGCLPPYWATWEVPRVEIQRWNILEVGLSWKKLVSWWPFQFSSQIRQVLHGKILSPYMWWLKWPG